MNLQQIITEADTLVDNGYTTADKVSWLNAINQDFFSVVKIPKVVRFKSVENQAEYTLPSEVRAKNIDLVRVDYTDYRSMMEDDVQMFQNFWTFDVDTKKISLTPAPFQNGQGIVRYHRIATSNFTSSNLTVSPDAPNEYHWVYVPALCAYICKAMDDTEKAAMYENDYRAALNAAAQNYQKQVIQ